MNKEDRLLLVAPCGIDCGTCELYLSKDNSQLLEHLVSIGIPEEKIPCQGCRSIQGKCPIMSETCATYKCVSEKNIDFCYKCDEFPCVKVQPTADRANTLPHNMKIYNLCKIEKGGLKSFIECSAEVKQRYFKGKMVIGEGPQI